MTSPVIIEQPFKWARNHCAKRGYIGWELPLARLRQRYGTASKHFVDALCEQFVVQAARRSASHLEQLLAKQRAEEEALAHKKAQRVSETQSQQSSTKKNLLARAKQAFTNIFRRKV